MEIPDKLKVIQPISKGNFGDVLLCENTYLSNRKEAVKIITTKGKEEKDRAYELNQNLFESSILEYLRQSPYIVKIYDAEFLENGFRINMEYLKNGSIQDLLNKQSFLSTKQILKISECILHALEYAHNKHIFHLDVKPGNILIENDNIYKLSDFGLSRVKNKDGTSSFGKIYTKHIPPERLSKSQIEATEQTDIYMFGVTAYRFLNGDSHMVKQWDSYNKKGVLQESIISGKFPNRADYLPHVHSKFKKIINKCLNIDLEKRYKNIRAVRNDFGKIKIKHTWICKNISKDLYHWECVVNKHPILELIAKKDNDLWEISLMKYNKKKKARISKHCNKKLKHKELNKKLGFIFNEYF